MSKLGRDFLRRGQLCRAWWVYDVDALLGSASWKGLVGKEIVLEGCVVWALGFVLGWLGKEVIEALGATAGAWVGLAGFVRWLRVAWLGR